MRAAWGWRPRYSLRLLLDKRWGGGATSDYSIVSEFGCDIGIDMFWASRTSVVYYGMEAIWPAMIGVVGTLKFISKEFMIMSASSFLPANEAD